MGCGASSRSAPADAEAARKPILTPEHRHILAGFASSLEAEYVNDQDQAVGRWLDSLPKPGGVVGNVSKDNFEEWLDNVERCVRPQAHSHPTHPSFAFLFSLAPLS